MRIVETVSLTSEVLKVKIFETVSFISMFFFMHEMQLGVIIS